MNIEELIDTDTARRLHLESNFYFFVRYMFKEVYNIDFIQNPHHEIIADELTAISAYEQGNTIFNIPPRYGKTELVVVMFIAWCIAKNAYARFMHLSYSINLALENSGKVKLLIQSDAFQRHWPVRLRQDTQSKQLWYTEHGGGLYAAPSFGQITGFGAGTKNDGDPGLPFGGAVIIDDPHKASDARSKTERDRVNRNLNESIASRRNSPKTPIILIMQRLHVEDMTGYLLAGGMGKLEPFKHVKIPAIFHGDPLWPAMHTMEKLKDMQKTDPYVFAGQYMQEPVPEGGAMFKTEWLEYYDYDSMSSHFSRFIPYILVDPANTKTKKSDYTAMIVVLTGADRNYYIVDIVRDKLNPVERINKVFDLHQKWTRKCKRPPVVCYEKVGLMSDVFYLKEEQGQRGYHMKIIEGGFAAKQSKEDRISALVPLFHNRCMYLPTSLVYIDEQNNRRDMVDEFINEEYNYFPMAAHDDMLDALARITDPKVPVIFPSVEAEARKYAKKYNHKPKQQQGFLRV